MTERPRPAFAVTYGKVSKPEPIIVLSKLARACENPELVVESAVMVSLSRDLHTTRRQLPEKKQNNRRGGKQRLARAAHLDSRQSAKYQSRNG